MEYLGEDISPGTHQIGDRIELNGELREVVQIVNSGDDTATCATALGPASPSENCGRRPMIYTIQIASPNTRHPGRTVFFAAKSTRQAAAMTQRLGASLNAIHPTLVAGPRMAPHGTGLLKGTLDGMRGPDAFDPMLLADDDYCDAYRDQRINLVGVLGLTPRECSEVLPF